MLTADKLLARGHLALDWAAGLVDEQEGFRGVGNIINGYYKSVVAFTTGARLREARQIANFIKATFLVDGDVNACPGDTTAPGFSNYRNAWVGRGVHVLGRYDMSAAIGDFVESQMDPVSGGLAAVPFVPEAEREYCWGSTGSGVLALMAMGRWEAAARGGAFLVGMIEEQPATKGKLYLRRRADRTLIDSDIRQGLALTYSIDVGAKGQIYWYLGIAMNAFANLYLATGDKKWTDAGYKVLEYFKNCDGEVYEIISNGKVAWGLAAMYAATRDRQFAKYAQDVWAWHYNVQSPDGRWLRVGQFGSLDEQPLHITLDTTLERAFYMFELSRTLDV
jgi:hypothetical protein